MFVRTPETKTDSEAGREDAKPDESESTTVATEAADLQLNKNDKPAAEEPEKPVSRTSLVLASRQKSLGNSLFPSPPLCNCIIIKFWLRICKIFLSCIVGLG